MNQFDISLVHRLMDDLENEAKSMKQNVNSPGDLKEQLAKLNSIIGSLDSHAKSAEKSGSNPIAEDLQIR